MPETPRTRLTHAALDAAGLIATADCAADDPRVPLITAIIADAAARGILCGGITVASHDVPVHFEAA